MAKKITIVTKRDGQRVRLLNPAEKAKKAAYELRTKTHVTNFGEVKTDKSGNPLPLTKSQRAYRAGMLDMRKVEAAAYQANRRKGLGNSSGGKPSVDW